jgi:hypothetical protein
MAKHSVPTATEEVRGMGDRIWAFIAGALSERNHERDAPLSAAMLRTDPETHVAC